MHENLAAFRRQKRQSLRNALYHHQRKLHLAGSSTGSGSAFISKELFDFLDGYFTFSWSSISTSVINIECLRNDLFHSLLSKRQRRSFRNISQAPFCVNIVDRYWWCSDKIGAFFFNFNGIIQTVTIKPDFHFGVWEMRARYHAINIKIS